MKKARKIILLLPSDREYDRGLVRGIINFAKIRGPWIFYEEPPDYLKSPSSHDRQDHMRAWKADGMIVPQARAHEVSSLRLPSVTVIGTHYLPPKTPQLRTDDKAIGELAARHLLGLGFQNFAYCGLTDMEWSNIRGETFKNTLKKEGRECYIYVPRGKQSGVTWFTEEKRLGTWLKQLPKPTALLACNDDWGRLLAEVCRINDVHVPDDVAILGSDNDVHVCLQASPSLSSISLATETAGYAMAELLHTLMEKRKPAQCCFKVNPLTVVTRQSTDLIATDDANIVKAIRFIRSNTSSVINVLDVSRAAGLSRRVLQDRFEKVTGRTVIEELHHVRVAHIRKLLSETNLSVGEIAEACGYSSDAHIARFFARRTGMTPYEYRRTHKLTYSEPSSLEP